MRVKAIAISAVLLSVSTAPWAYSRQSSEAAKQMTAEDVISLVKAGVSESLIIAKLRSQGRPVDLSPQQMILLKREGIPDRLVAAMLDPQGSQAPQAGGTVMAQPTDLSGFWDVSLSERGERLQGKLTLSQNGSALSGNLELAYGQQRMQIKLTSGLVSAGQVAFSGENERVDLKFNGTISVGVLKGTLDLTDRIMMRGMPGYAELHALLEGTRARTSAPPPSNQDSRAPRTEGSSPAGQPLPQVGSSVAGDGKLVPPASADLATNAEGKYVRADKPKDYLGLLADGTLVLSQDGKHYTGRYQIEGTKVTMTIDRGPTSVSILQDRALVDPNGQRWVKITR